MLSSRKARIAHAFDGANDYDAHATIQREVAARLATRIASLDVDVAAPALEIGCGTGFLTRALLKQWPDLPLIASDIAPAMLERTRELTGHNHSGLSYEVLDGEQINAPGRYGLIASSLAFQWFEDAAAAIDRMIGSLRPGGWLVFSTLIPGTFREWIKAQQEAGLPTLTRDFRDIPALTGSILRDCEVSANSYSLTEHHADGLSFLRGLKAIGAASRWNDAPSPAGALREAIRIFEQAGASVTYEIAEIVIRRAK